MDEKIKQIDQDNNSGRVASYAENFGNNLLGDIKWKHQ